MFLFLQTGGFVVAVVYSKDSDDLLGKFIQLLEKYNLYPGEYYSSISCVTNEKELYFRVEINSGLAVMSIEPSTILQEEMSRVFERFEDPRKVEDLIQDHSLILTKIIDSKEDHQTEIVVRDFEELTGITFSFANRKPPEMNFVVLSSRKIFNLSQELDLVDKRGGRDKEAPCFSFLLF